MDRREFGQVDLSVVMPVLNGADTVLHAIDSALAASGVRVEVIAVDDGSTDNGPGLVAGRVSRDDRVRWFDLDARRRAGDHGRGAGAARTFGLAQARGRYVLFLDADDAVEPDGPRRLIQAAERQRIAGGAGAAYGSISLCGEDLQELGWIAGSAGAGGRLTGESFSTGNALVNGAQQVIALDLIRGERFGPTRTCEDWDLWLRLCGRGVEWGACGGPPVARYRIRPGSLMKDFWGVARDGVRVLQEAGARGQRVDVDGFRRRAALDAATRSALMGAEPRECVRAAHEFAPGARWTTGELASSAAWGMVFARGAALDLGNEANAACLRTLDALWTAWSEIDGEVDVDGAWRTFARESVNPRAIAAWLLDRIAPSASEPPLIVGLGRNGTALLAEARERGLEVLAWDDDPEVRRAWASHARIVDPGDLRVARRVALSPRGAPAVPLGANAGTILTWTQAEEALAERATAAISERLAAASAR